MWRVAAPLLLAASGLASVGCGADASALAPAAAGGTGGHMWAAGERGLMASAFDGVTLVARPSATGAWLRALVCVDDQLAWAFGEGGTILTTRDGGASWAPAVAPTAATLRGASFADAGRGYAVGDGGVILRTTDAGATWTRLLGPAAGGLEGVAAAASGGLVLVVGEAGTVLRSADGGDRFDRMSVPTGAALHAVRLAGDELHALAVGEGGVVIASDDGGLSWRAESPAPVELRGLALGGRGATAVGAGGVIWRRADADGPWAQVWSGTTVDLAAVKFDREAPDFGWIVGAAATVLYTSDGGAHFRPLQSPLRGGLTTVEDF